MAKRAASIQYYKSVGRRKGAVATARLYLAVKGKAVTVDGKQLKPGEVFVNSLPITEAISSPLDRKIATTPLTPTDSSQRFVVSVKVSGGGVSGQKEAIANALAKALVVADAGYKHVLREHGLITRDPRVRERRKVGTGGKARRRKQSPKR